MLRLSVFFVVAILAADCAFGIFLGGVSFLRPKKNLTEICSGICNDAPKIWLAGTSHQRILCEICKSKVTAFPFLFSNTTPEKNKTTTAATTPTPSTSAASQAPSSISNSSNGQASTQATNAAASSEGSTTVASSQSETSTEATTMPPMP